MIKERDGEGRLRFVSWSQRLQSIDIDVVHRIKDRHTNDDATPDTGSKGCHLQDELERCKDLETSRQFQQLYYELWPLVQSLPELLHHLEAIKKMLLLKITNVPVNELPPYFRLLSSLSNDLREDMGPHFHEFFGVIVKRVSSCAFTASGQPTPELAGKAFECLGYMIKYYLPVLSVVSKASKKDADRRQGGIDGPESMRVYYGEILGSSTPFVRNMAAKCLSQLFRKLKASVFRSHYRKVVKAMSSSVRGLLANKKKEGATWELFPANSITTADEEFVSQHRGGYQGSLQEGTGSSCGESGLRTGPAVLHPRVLHLLDGLGAVLYNTTRGVKGCLHSQGMDRLRDAAALMMPLNKAQTVALLSQLEDYNNRRRVGDQEDPKECLNALHLGSPDQALTSLPETLPALSYSAGMITKMAFVRLFRHVHPRNAAELWVIALELCSQATKVMTIVQALCALNGWNVSSVAPSADQGGNKKHKNKKKNDDNAVSSSQLTNSLQPLIHSAKLAVLVVMELLIFALTHSQGRGLSDDEVKAALGKHIVNATMALCSTIFSFRGGGAELERGLPDYARVIEKAREVFCAAWAAFPKDPAMLTKAGPLLEAELTQLMPTPALGQLGERLSGGLPAEVVRSHLLGPLLRALAAMGVDVIRTTADSQATWLALVVDLLYKIKDNRPALSKENASDGPIDSIRSNYPIYEEDYGAERGRESEDDYDDSDDLEEEGDDGDGAGENSLKRKRGRQASLGRSGVEGVRGVGQASANGVGSDIRMKKRLEAAMSIILEQEEEEEEGDDMVVTQGNGGASASASDVAALLSSNGLRPRVQSIASTCVDFLSRTTGILLSSRPSREGNDKDESMLNVIALLASRALLWFKSEYPACISGEMNGIMQSLVMKVVSSGSKSIGKIAENPSTAACSLSLLGALHVLSLSLDPLGGGEKDRESHVEAVVASLYCLFTSHPTSVPILSALHTALSSLPRRTPAISGEPVPANARVKLVGNSIMGGQASSGEDGSLPVISGIYQTCAGVDNRESEGSPSVEEIIAQVLTTSSYWVRLHALQLLQHLPRPQVSLRHSHVSNNRNKGGEDEDTAVVVHVLDTYAALQALASLPPSLHTEREFARRMDTLAATVRGYAVPPDTLRILVGFALGMFHCKFSPYWDASRAFLVVVSQVEDNKEGAVLWDLLKPTLVASFRTPTAGASQEGDFEKDEGMIQALLRDRATPTYLRTTIQLLQIDHKNSPTLTPSLSAQRVIDVAMGTVSVPFEVASSRAFHCKLPLLGVGHESKYQMTSDSALQAAMQIEGASDEEAETGREGEEETRGARKGGKGAPAQDVVQASLPDSRADSDSVHHSLVSLLKDQPSLVLLHSKVVISLFLAFLKQQYYRHDVLKNDPDVPHLTAVGLFSPSLASLEEQKSAEAEEVSVELPLLPLKVLKGRLLAYLQCLAAVTNPKGLHRHALLLEYYATLVVHPEAAVSKASLECLFAYKPAYLNAAQGHHDALRALLSEDTFRDALLGLASSLGSSSLGQDEDGEADGRELQKAIGATLLRHGKGVQRGSGTERNGAAMSSIIVTAEQRSEFVSLVSRLVFGRFATRTGRSRSNREATAARRNAVLTFLSSLRGGGDGGESATGAGPVHELGELSTFVHLVLRSIMPSSELLSLGKAELKRSEREFVEASSRGAYYRARADKGDEGVLKCDSWHRLTWQLAERVTVSDLHYAGSSTGKALGEGDAEERGSGVSVERQSGFLKLLEFMIKQLGVKLTPSVPLLVKLVMRILTQAHSYREDGLETKAQLLAEEDVEEENEDEDNGDDTAQARAGPVSNSEAERTRLLAQAAKVRTLALLRIGELVQQYPASVIYSEDDNGGLIMGPLQPLLSALPSAIPHAPRPSGLLLLLDAVSGSTLTITLLLKSPPAITAIIKSIAQSGLKCDHSVRLMLLSLLSRLLEADNGVTLQPYAAQIVDAFTVRFSGGGRVTAEEAATGSKFDPASVSVSTTSLHHEIHLLCALSESVFLGASNSTSSSTRSSSSSSSGHAEIGGSSSDLSSEQCYNLASLLLAMLIKFTSPDARRKMSHPAGGRSFGSNGVGNGSPMDRDTAMILQMCGVYISLSGRISDLTSHVSALSRIFGPSLSAVAPSTSQSSISPNGVDAGPSMANPRVRAQVCEVYRVLTEHPSLDGQLDVTARTLKALVAVEGGDDDTGAQSDSVAIKATSARSLVAARDFDKSLPVLLSLGKADNQSSTRVTPGEGEWGGILRARGRPPKGTGKGHQGALVAMNNNAVVLEVLRCLFDAELVVRRAAAAAIRRLVEACCEWSVELSVSPGSNSTTATAADPYVMLLKTSILPILRRGLRCANDEAKSTMLELITHVGKVFERSPRQLAPELAQDLHVDLSALSSTSGDTEQDFASNVFHIQIHRRTRALGRVRTMLEPHSAGSPCPLKQATLVHVLLPLCLSYLLSEQYAKTDYAPLLLETVSLLRALGSHLPWKHYYSTTRTLLKVAEKTDIGSSSSSKRSSGSNGREAKEQWQQRSSSASAREKLLFSALCGLLDAFPTSAPVSTTAGTASPGEKEKDEEEEEEEEEEGGGQSKARASTTHTQSATPGSGTYNAITKVLLPWLQRLLTRDTADKKGNRVRKIRPQVAVAMSKLIVRLPVSSATASASANTEALSARGKDKDVRGPAGVGSPAHLITQLVIDVVNTLKSRDLAAREGARAGLVGIVRSAGLGALHIVTYELQQQLKEGYMRHVANFTLRTILTSCLEGASGTEAAGSGGRKQAKIEAAGEESDEEEVEQAVGMPAGKTYMPPIKAPSLLQSLLAHDQATSKEDDDAPIPTSTLLDEAVPQIMVTVLDDLVGEASRDREVGSAAGAFSGDGDGITTKRSIKETKGVKAHETLELLGRYILFRPTYRVVPFVPRVNLVSAFDDRERKRRLAEADETEDGKEETAERMMNGVRALNGAVLTFNATSGKRVPFAVEVPSGVRLGSYSSLHHVITPLLEQVTGSRQGEANSDDGGEALEAGEEASMQRRMWEALSRVSTGLARNPSLSATELLLYLHATLTPYVAALVRSSERKRRARGVLRGAALGDNEEEEEEDDDDVWGDTLPSYLAEESSDEEEAALYSKKKKKKKSKSGHQKGNDVKGYAANIWLPTLDSSSQKGQRDVIMERDAEIAERGKVLDGKLAPVLTGRNRHNAAKNKVGLGSSHAQAGGGSSSSSSAADNEVRGAQLAVRFCLSLLQGALKRGRLDSSDDTVRSMATPFIPLLVHVLRLSSDTDDHAQTSTTASNAIVASSVKVVVQLLSWGLPVKPRFSRLLGSRLLKVMMRSGVVLHSDKEIVQTCMKGLTSLFSYQNQQKLLNRDAIPKQDKGKTEEKGKTGDTGRQGDNGGTSLDTNADDLPLSLSNIQSLLSLLTATVTEITTTHQNASYALIKAIVDSRVVVAQVYDLMDKLSESIVLSDRKGVSHSSTACILHYMSTYPMGGARVEGHIKKLMANLHFEFAAGRLAAIQSIRGMMGVLPPAMLDDHHGTLFLPLMLQIVNDNDASCRRAAGEAVLALARRLGSEPVASLLAMSSTWLRSDGKGGKHERSLIRTGAQALALLVEARPDKVKNTSGVGGTASLVNTVIQQCVIMLGTDDKCQIVWENAANASLTRRVNLLERGDSRGQDDHAGEGEGKGGGVEGWAVVYHLLSLLEALYAHLPGGVDYALTRSAISQGRGGSSTRGDAPVVPPGVELVQECCLYPHSWVRSVSARLLVLYLHRRDPRLLPVEEKGQDRSSKGKEVAQGAIEVLRQPNGLYHLARRLCVMLDQPSLPAPLFGSICQGLVWTAKAAHAHPELAISTGGPRGSGASEVHREEKEDLDDEDEEEEEEEEWELVDEESESPQAQAHTEASKSTHSGSTWLLARLRGLGLDSRGDRRLHVLTIFEALAKEEDEEGGSFGGGEAKKAESEGEGERSSLVAAHGAILVEVALRARLVTVAPSPEALDQVHHVSASLLGRLERILGSAAYIEMYSNVQRRVEGSKHAQRRKRAAEAVADPASFAKRKVEKQQRKKESRKRKKEKASVKGSKRLRNNQLAYTFEN